MSEDTKVRTCIWIERDGLGAARLYTSLLPNSQIRDEQKFKDMRNDAPDAVQMIEFTLAGAPYQILQAGPHQTHTDMMSISVTAEDQDETDRLWTALTADGGAEGQCGWLKDRWGVAWQIVPRRFTQLMGSDNAAKVGAMMTAMMPMKKLDIAALEAAFNAA